MKNNKAASPDGIQAEIYKLGGLTQHKLHQFLIKVWIDEVVTSDLRDANFITIYTNTKVNGIWMLEASRGTSLLATADKVLARILTYGQ